MCVCVCVSDWGEVTTARFAFLLHCSTHSCMHKLSSTFFDWAYADCGHEIRISHSIRFAPGLPHNQVYTHTHTHPNKAKCKYKYIRMVQLCWWIRHTMWAKLNLKSRFLSRFAMRRTKPHSRKRWFYRIFWVYVYICVVNSVATLMKASNCANLCEYNNTKIVSFCGSVYICIWGEKMI